MRSYQVTLALTAWLTLAGCTQPGPVTPTAGPPTTVPASAVPTSTAGQPRQTLAVYYTLTWADKGPRLVREFHQLQAGADPAAQVRAAVTEMLTGDALDPDYVDLWPARARVRDVSVAAGVATVDLGDARQANLGAEGSLVALQQLVWTATAVPTINSVKIMLDGMPTADLWGHLDISGPQRRLAAAEVLYPVWLISPQHGEHMGRRVTLHIAGIAFEATVTYEIKRAGTVVKHGFVTLDKGAPGQGEATQVIDLDQPGTYMIAAYLTSAADESRLALDDHTITVG